MRRPVGDLRLNNFSAVILVAAYISERWRKDISPVNKPVRQMTHYS